MVTDLLRSVFTPDIEHDVREPVFRFTVSQSAAVGLIPPHPTVMCALLPLTLVIISTVNAVVAVATYTIVIRRRGSIESRLGGYGAILPVVAILPFCLVDWLQTHNLVIFVGIGGNCAVLFFRCLMAIHGTLPPYADVDFKSFVLFFISPVQFKFDPQTGQVLKSSTADFLQVLLRTCQTIAIVSVLLPLLIQHSFQLFPRRPDLNNNFFDLFHWSHLLNNYAVASMTGHGLAAASQLVGTTIQGLTGMAVIELCDSPLTKSTSLSDFWGRRWNLLVHIVLKGGVYKPLRKNGYRVGVAAVATFVVSGLLHEYLLYLFSMKARILGDENSAPAIRYGIQSAFFAWNGFVMLVENAVSKHPLIVWMSNNLPRPLITAFVIGTVLPVGHWFTDEYVKIGFFEDLSLGMPMLVWIPSEGGNE
ncbi:Probable long-chain-alcohol O-fatty-acyltransferase [Seminavis robusta]|uniref:Probable long-chain-alcohol O-fatty-acyltransferase n=1 Tax=Seminavis robusta TaxID=568900 RepID=A0A9N8DGZ5_9STRA|nr:Probable long-chain-alcohol O-fatty-acyltransferase [Seminavis robusta]|eukprot:Sro62_g035560.1 Probable long-chain-alcohol O-fatty-acyltransferase (419) ;mRNA; f:119296-120552